LLRLAVGAYGVRSTRRRCGRSWPPSEHRDGGLKRKPALPLLMAERVGAACAGCLNVELLQDLDREGDVPGSEDVVGAGGLALLFGSREMA